MRSIKKILSLQFIFISLISLTAQGIEFYDGDYKDAFKMAEEEEKLVFVDAYAVWCGPCKKMAATTFKEASVGDFFNTEFINLKIDMEKGQGLEFRKKYPVSAYPTLLFIDGSGNVVHKATGAKQADALIALGKAAMGKNDQSGKYAKLYEEGNREFATVLKYVKSLNKVGKSSLVISNEYLRSNPSLTKSQKAEFLYEAATDADSRLFDIMLEYRPQLEGLKGKAEMIAKIEEACCKTVEKAVEFESPELLSKAKQKMKKNAKSEYKAFNVKADMDYFEGIGEIDKYLEKTAEYSKKVIKDDADQLMTLATSLTKKHKNNSKAIELAQKSMQKSIEIEDSSNSRLTYATILHEADRKPEAIIQANKALQLAKEKGESTKKIEGMIRYLESQ